MITKSQAPQNALEIQRYQQGCRVDTWKDAKEKMSFKASPSLVIGRENMTVEMLMKRQPKDQEQKIETASTSSWVLSQAERRAPAFQTHLAWPGSKSLPQGS